jgi:hypothetical protein
MNPMNPSRHPGFCLLLGGIFILWSAAPLTAATTNSPAATNATAHAAASTNANLSVFDPKGRNPFFPATASEIAVGPGGEAQPAVLLALKGISGASNRRFAIINDRTFAVNDESEVIIPGGGRIRIRCVEIRDNIAVVTIGRTGDRIELKLPTRF